MQKFILFFFTIIISNHAWACAVIPTEDYSVIKAVKADTVVVGKVISKTMISNTFNARLHIKTSVWLRGSGDKDMSIIEQNCTREFRSGREYIFLFHENKLIGSLSYSKENLSTVYGDTKYGS